VRKAHQRRRSKSANPIAIGERAGTGGCAEGDGGGGGLAGSAGAVPENRSALGYGVIVVPDDATLAKTPPEDPSKGSSRGPQDPAPILLTSMQPTPRPR
jgi:hypothetical protein